MLDIGGLLRLLNFKPMSDQSSQFELENANYLSPCSFNAHSEIPVVNYKEAREIHAYGLVCLHFGCMIEKYGSDFNCPCHGSLYSYDRMEIKRPAQKSLKMPDMQIPKDDLVILSPQTRHT